MILLRENNEPFLKGANDVEKSETAVEISLLENAVYVVKQGKLTKLTSKKHGQDLIIWKDGQVLDIDRSERVRISGQEVI